MRNFVKGIAKNFGNYIPKSPQAIQKEYFYEVFISCICTIF